MLCRVLAPLLTRKKAAKMISLPPTLHPTMPLHPRRRGGYHHRWLLNLHLDPEETTPGCRFGERGVLPSV